MLEFLAVYGMMIWGTFIIFIAIAMLLGLLTFIKNLLDAGRKSTEQAIAPIYRQRSGRAMMEFLSFAPGYFVAVVWGLILGLPLQVFFQVSGAAYLGGFLFFVGAALFGVHVISRRWNHCYLDKHEWDHTDGGEHDSPHAYCRRCNETSYPYTKR